MILRMTNFLVFNNSNYYDSPGHVHLIKCRFDQNTVIFGATFYINLPYEYIKQETY